MENHGHHRITDGKCEYHDECFETFDKKLDENTKLTKDIYEALRGDLGKQGWLTRIEQCENSLKRLNAAIAWLLSPVILGIMGYIGGLLTGLIKITYTFK